MVFRAVDPGSLTTTMPEFVAAMTTEEMFAMILAKLEETNAQLHALAELSMPPPTPIPFAVNDDREDEVEVCTSSKPATASSASPTSSPTSSPPRGDDSAVLIASSDQVVATHSRCSTLGLYKDADVDRLSSLPDSLIRNIVARLPIKDAGRTAVLSCRWSSIWHAAPLRVNHADLTVNSNRFYSLVPRSSVGLLEQIRLQQQGRTRPLLADNDDATSPTKYSSMGFLHRSARIWPADLRTGVGTMLDAVYAVDIFSTSKSATPSSASLRPSPSSAPPQKATMVVAADTCDHLEVSPIRCSTLGLYRIVITLMPAHTSSASPMSTSPTSIDHRQGNKLPKPPWLLGTEVSHSWSGRMQLISGFLLEISPWCSFFSGVSWEFKPWPLPNSAIGCSLSIYLKHIPLWSTATLRISCCLDIYTGACLFAWSFTVYSIYISCDSRPPSVLVIQVFELYTDGQFGQFLIIYANGSIKDFDHLELEKGPRADQHFGLLTHFGGHEDLTMLHQLGIFTEFSGFVDTYWTLHDIKYAELVPRVQIQRICWQRQEPKLLEVLILCLMVDKALLHELSECCTSDGLVMLDRHHNLHLKECTDHGNISREVQICAASVSNHDPHHAYARNWRAPSDIVLETPWDPGAPELIGNLPVFRVYTNDHGQFLQVPQNCIVEGAVRVDPIAYEMLHLAVQILEMLECHLPCTGNTVTTQVLLK